MTSTEGAGNRILGALRSHDGTGVVTVQDRFDTDIDDLWSAITDPDRLARWLGQVEGDLRVGGSSARTFRWRAGGKAPGGWKRASRPAGCSSGPWMTSTRASSSSRPR